MTTTTFDLAVIMALHREGTLLSATLSSYDHAFAQLHKHGYTAQLVVTLDRPDATTLRAFEGYIFRNISDVTLVICDYGDLGLARNHGIALANAMYIATADGDDLISPNYLERSLTLARAERTPTIFIPQFLFSFGAITGITIYPRCLSDNSLAWFDHNYGVSRVLAHHQVFNTIPYKALRNDGVQYAYEDWTFNTDCIAAGIQIRHVPNTVLFYRRHERSITHTNNIIGANLRTTSSLFEPTSYVHHARSDEQASPNYETNDDLPFDDLYRSVSEIREAFYSANFLEPELAPHVYRSHHASLIREDISIRSRAYFYLCQMLSGFVFSDVFLVPSLDQSGAPRYLSHVMHSLYSMFPTNPVLVVCGEPLRAPDSISWLPSNVFVVDFNILLRGLSSQDVFFVLVRLLQHITPNARIHMTTSSFALDFVRAQHTYLSSRCVVLYRFSNPAYFYHESLFVNGEIISFIRKFHAVFSAIIYDSRYMLERDRIDVPYITPFTSVLYTKTEIVVNTSVGSTLLKVNDSDTGALAVLWASRPAPEKRISLLSEIATQLHRLHPSIVIHVYGGDLKDFLPHSQNLVSPNIVFKGTFNSFILDCTVESYRALLYTSHYDGIPNIILESIASGIPVIAPDVGGISEVVINKTTGLLVPSVSSDQEMASQYILNLEALIHDTTFAQSLAQNAIKHIQHAFSAELHKDTLRGILDTLMRLHSKNS